MPELTPVTELLLAVCAWQATPSELAARERMRRAGYAVELDREGEVPPAVQQLAVAAQRAAEAPASHYPVVMESLAEVLQVIDPESRRNAAKAGAWQDRADLR